ncbi:MAG: FWWh domain-containing protein [Bacteroidia bacterium]|nr:FWWh domain-containing protein [Bacteroidia bacterium]
MAKRAATPDTPLFESGNRLFFVTNRMNLIQVLSTGLIRPREAYGKYYPDLLELFPGSVPLFHGGFPKSLLQMVSDRERGIFPVLIEIDSTQLSAAGKRMQIGNNLCIFEGNTQVSGDILVEIVEAPIPIAAVVQLWFVKQDDLEDFEARDFPNVLASPQTGVSETLLLDSGPDPDQFRDCLSTITHSPASAEHFRHLDAAMGAAALLSIQLPPVYSWIEDFTAAVSFLRPIKPKPSHTPAWLASSIKHIMLPDRGMLEVSSVDERLMLAAIHVLRSLHPQEGWLEEKIADAIALQAASDAEPALTAEINKWREHVIAVARAEKSAPTLDDSGSVVRRGLMLLLLRCDPERILRACDTPLNPGPQVAAIAGMLSGLFHGYSRLDRSIKSRACHLDLLSKLAVHWWSGTVGQSTTNDFGVTIRHKDQTTAIVAATVDQSIMLERTIKPSDAMMRVYYEAKSVGFSSEFRPEFNALVYNYQSEQNTIRQIIIEEGPPTNHPDITIRVRTSCLMRNGKPVRITKREEATDLLERNYNPSALCRFAVQPGTGNVEVLVHQLLSTMDSAELQMHIEAVGNTADEYEIAWMDRQKSSTKRNAKRDEDQQPDAFTES